MNKKNIQKYMSKVRVPKVAIRADIKKSLPKIAFALLIPLGVLVGYFFSHVKEFMAGGFQDALTPINKMFYVAKVDGVGITRKEWEDTLKSRYGQNAAKELIDVYTVRNELTKAGITVSDADINAKITEIEKQLAGQNLEDILKQQGRTLTDFRKDVYLQVGMEKLLGSKVTVTDQEVEDYIKSAGASLEGSTDEEKKANAKKALMDQKLGEEINKWFSEIQSKAKVINYLDETK